jgi:tetratricopeptide (TPR) repeat protein
MRAMRKLVFFRPHRGRFFVAAVLVAFSLGGFSPTAEAGDSRATAKAHYETATRLYDIREYDKALREYKSAYLAQPDPAFLFNIGQCHRKLGQNQQALNFFQEYLKKASPDDPNRSQVEARVRDIEAEAKLKAEEAQAAAAAMPAPAPAPEVVPPAPTPATAAVAATPAAPAASVEQAVPVNAPASGRGLRIAGMACGATGLVSVGIGIYYYTRARSLSDSVTTSQNPKASDDQAGRDAQTMQWVFYGIGAGALAAGTVLYLLGWPTKESGRTVAVPMVGPGLAGISAQGTF